MESLIEQRVAIADPTVMHRADAKDTLEERDTACPHHRSDSFMLYTVVQKHS